MTIEQMREKLANVPEYSASKAWKEKVKKMKNSQVTAVYFSFLNRGVFNTKPRKSEQLSLF